MLINFIIIICIIFTLKNTEMLNILSFQKVIDFNSIIGNKYKQWKQ